MDRVQKALERQYKGLCTVWEQQSVKDPVTKLTSQKPVKVLEDVKCKLSYSSLAGTSDNNGAPEKVLTPKLFLSPDVVIKAGSKIVVTQDGITTEFCNSGEPGHFKHHQEIELKLFERYA